MVFLTTEFENSEGFKKEITYVGAENNTFRSKI
jgi:hypothetical protein